MGKIKWCKRHKKYTYGKCPICKDRKKEMYFAHPFPMIGTKLEAEAMKAIADKGYIPINPFEKEGHLEDKYGGPYYEKVSREFARDIVDADLETVDELDGVIAFLPRKWLEENTKAYLPIGTPMEIMHAHQKGKYVIIITERPSPFLLCYSDEFYESLEDFINDKQTQLASDYYKDAEFVDVRKKKGEK